MLSVPFILKDYSIKPPVIFIIWLMLSHLVSPKVITLGGFYSSSVPVMDLKDEDEPQEGHARRNAVQVCADVDLESVFQHFFMAIAFTKKLYMERTSKTTST